MYDAGSRLRPSKWPAMIGVFGGRGRLTAFALGLVVTTAALAAPAAAAGHEVGLQTKWAKYSYSGRGDGFLEIVGSAKIVPGTFFATVDVDRPNSSKADAFFPFILDLDSLASADSYGAVGNRDLCAGPVDCHVTGGAFSFSVGFTIQGGGDTPMGLNTYVVLRGADVKIHDILVHGWTAHHHDGGALRVTDSQAGGAGVDAFGSSAGANTGARAPGPRAGSVAIAVPACDQVGAGVLLLTGGEQTQTALCPSDAIAAVARHAAKWTATGAVAGVSTYSTRLLVIDA